MLGEKHREIANWLVDNWSTDNRRICVIEGFSGVGKSEVASEVERRISIGARIDAPESGEIDDLMLDLSQQLAVQGHLELANAIDSGTSTELAFEQVLLKPVHIVIDEFQRMVDMATGTPYSRMAALIERVSKRAAPGRLLLLSHHALDKTRRWGERVEFKTLTGLSPEEGADLLGQLLASRGREADIPSSRRPEVSRWLGGNPRAIRVLVGCLEQEALDDLTGVLPEAWEARDQEVSQGLISKLERELLVRALENLDGACASTLEKLSVYRKAVTVDGIMRVLSPALALDYFLAELSSRFLLEQHAGWYSLNPIVREISRHRLKQNSRETLVAHRAAAGNYTRHFAAKKIVNAAGKLGGAFVEARYHLVQADDLAELSDIARRFGVHLCSVYRWNTPEAQGETQRDEIISVLSAYLEYEGPNAMEYHLARLLYTRNRPGDYQRALEHVRRSTGPHAWAAAWVLRLRLEAEVADIELMLQAAQQGFEMVPAEANLFAIYQIAADLLTEAGRVPEAIDLLEEGISKISPSKGLYSLYLAEADLLVSTGEAGDAILLLRQALIKIPVEYNLYAIYVRVSQILVTEERTVEAIDLLRDATVRIPTNKGLFAIYLSLAEALSAQGEKSEAIRALEEGVQKVTTGHDRTSVQTALKRLIEAPSPSEEIAKLDNERPSSESSLDKRFNDSTPAGRCLHILTLGTEWESRHGGLSTFNRELSIALAAAGHQVVCIVPESTVKERNAAEAAGVHLVSPSPEFGLEGSEKLLLNTQLPENFHPVLIIGHDRKTGPHANVLTQRYKNTKFVLFIHTRPEDIEWHKDKLGPDDTATTAEARRHLLKQLAGSAALVVGVGPKLTKSAETLVYLADPQPIVHQLNPGFSVSSRPARLPPEIQCLLLGRAEDWTLKGLDIAAKALGEVNRRNRIESAPRLVVRGAPIGTGQDLRVRLIEFAGGKLDVEVRDYSPNLALLQQDILMSSLVLMPSRSEGFGLVALEAIAANTPVLVSDRSGLATLLKELLGKEAHSMIVETRDDLLWSAQEWERAIEAVLIDRNAAFSRAKALRVKLNDTFDWQDAIRQLEKVWTPLLADL
ncbi:glycosyltransferase [Pseudomonas marginalis]|uniref:Uncharacterized protein n=2 Tax=Pseudomonas marginalis TaxID=298 RepID=A0A3M4AT94_PSEMA|nr:glycosyltransferase [Pseudomonas marginalis]OAJ47909.1 hypothetical protein AO064_26540 [Pseudomonas marginalis]RMO55190.1 hypothetical protein ALQ38_01786 [Pseudomonas marginalis pv. marginalis]RMP10061.1 hypothetical protein ALQ29_01195 [Pseudomonas marginalis pv. marginalis]